MFRAKLVGDGLGRRNKASNINAALAAEVNVFVLFRVFPQPVKALPFPGRDPGLKPLGLMVVTRG